MATKNMAYDHAAYLTRLSHAYGQNAAGASTAFGKFVAFTNLYVYSVTGAQITAGTSTQTQWNGTGTVVTINGDAFYLVHVFNGTAASTATHGPFALALGTGTQTSTAGVWATVALSGTATTGNVQAGSNATVGGVLVNQGDTLHVLRGTDATAVAAYAIEYGLVPLTNVTQ